MAPTSYILDADPIAAKVVVAMVNDVLICLTGGVCACRLNLLQFYQNQAFMRWNFNS